MERIRLGTCSLEHPIFNGAGSVKKLADVEKLARSAVSAITLGSITLQPREGNVGQVWAQADGYCLNSLGLPNPGLPYYQDHLGEMVALAENVGKPLIVSVAGYHPDEYRQLARVAHNNGASMVELNLGCPNVWGDDGKQKPIASFNPFLVAEIINLVKEVVPAHGFGLKLSPYSNPGDLLELMDVLQSFSSYVGFITMTNTFPNAYGRANNRQMIDVGAGFAGMSGKALKPIALGQVLQAFSILEGDEIQIIGVGGITTGQDVVDFIASGATAVQVVSHYVDHENPGVFSDLLSEYVGLVS